ncbi:MAG: DUF998 domain-containing protein [Tunicatimonas sp.]
MAPAPPNSLVYEPSATIFNVTMIVAGLLIILATVGVHQSFGRWLFTGFLGLLGVGMLGVGIFPGHVAVYHGLFSLLTFVSGGIAAIVTYQITTAPLRYFGLIYGMTALFFLFAANLLIPTLGSGGTERWVAYPIVLWLIGLGGYLLGHQSSLISSQIAIDEDQNHAGTQPAGRRHRSGRPAAAPKL